MTRSRRPLLALALAGAALAAAPALAGAPGSAAVTSTPVFDQAAPIDTDDGNSAAEPSIRAAADGTLYITAPAGLGSGTTPRVADNEVLTAGGGGDLLWRSDDGGTTWRHLGSYDGAAGGGDSDIVTSPNGTVYASGLTLACITLSRSTDRGQSWLANPVGGCGGLPVDDRQWNDVYREEAVFTAWGNIALGHIQVARAGTAAVVAQSAPPVQVSQEANYQWPGVLDVDQRDGSVYVGWNTTGAPNDCDAGPTACGGRPASSDEPDEIRLAVLDKAGQPVSGSPFLVAARSADTFDSFVGVDTGRDGTVHAVWSERHPESAQTWTVLASSKDKGRTWSTPVKVNQAPATTAFPWVSAGDAGRVAVTYYGTAAGGRSPETVNGDWAVWSSLSTDGGATFTEVKATPTMHKGPICTSGTGCAAGTRDLADFMESDYDKNGCVVVTYTDNSRDVVTPTGTRTTNAAERIAFVRQVAGPGLLADRECTPARFAG